MNDWLLIALMAVVTFVPRYLPFALAGRVKLPATLERGLDFVPVAVLTAIIAQTTLIRGGEFDLTIGNLHAIAAAAAFVAALVTRHLFLTIAVGLLVFGGLKLLVL